ncbi:MAG: PEP-CTERM sorting domain-containing protein [Fimbriimonadaceae bacterium]
MKLVLIASGVGLAALSQATTLTFTGVADDFFDAYVSTNDSVQGTLFAQQTATWQSGGATGSITLTPFVTNYLHVKARDAFGAPSMFIGQASLDNTDFEFLNTTQSILTNTADWNLSLTGFGSGYFTPADLGQNGTGPWGTQGNVNINARRLWSTPNGGGGEQYFSIAIRSNAVPEPMTMVGLAVLGLVASRRKLKQS